MVEGFVGRAPPFLVWPLLVWTEYDHLASSRRPAPAARRRPANAGQRRRSRQHSPRDLARDRGGRDGERRRPLRFREIHVDDGARRAGAAEFGTSTDRWG